MNTITFCSQEYLQKEKTNKQKTRTRTKADLQIYTIKRCAQQSGKLFVVWDTSSEMLKTLSCDFL